MNPEPIVIVGRGHSGTSMLSHTLVASRVFMGPFLNEHGDTMLPQPMYEAASLVGGHVRWRGGLSWDFDELHTMPVDRRFEELVETYLKDVLGADGRARGWKLPETTLAFPWVVRMFPAARYIYIVRDPRDCLLRSHRTDDLRDSDVPCAEDEDELDRRVASWKYQYEIVRATPPPEYFLSIRYEDLVLDNESTMQRLEGFLAMPLARIVVDRTRVGQWRSDRRLLSHIQPLLPTMREMGYEE